MTTYTRTNLLYDYAIDAQPLLSAASIKYPFKRSTADFRKDQFDSSADPGEQSLRNWWVRAQTSWHMGSGVVYQEPTRDDEVIYSINQSLRIDILGTLGQFKLLPEMPRRVTNNAMNQPLAVSTVNPANGDALIYYNSNNGNTLLSVWNDSAATNTVVTPGGASTMDELYADAGFHYNINGGVLYRGAIPSTAATSWYTGLSGNTNRLRRVKGRLVLASGLSIYELAGSTPPTLPTPIFTHSDPSW